MERILCSSVGTVAEEVAPELFLTLPVSRHATLLGSRDPRPHAYSPRNPTPNPREIPVLAPPLVGTAQYMTLPNDNRLLPDMICFFIAVPLAVALSVAWLPVGVAAAVLTFVADCRREPDEVSGRMLARDHSDVPENER